MKFTYTLADVLGQLRSNIFKTWIHGGLALDDGLEDVES